MCVVGEADGELLAFVSVRQSTTTPYNYLFFRCVIWARVPTSEYLSGYIVMLTLADGSMHGSINRYADQRSDRLTF